MNFKIKSVTYFVYFGMKRSPQTLHVLCTVLLSLHSTFNSLIVVGIEACNAKLKLYLSMFAARLASALFQLSIPAGVSNCSIVIPACNRLQNV